MKIIEWTIYLILPLWASTTTSIWTFYTIQDKYLLSRAYIYQQVFRAITLLEIKNLYKNHWDSETTSNFWRNAANHIHPAQGV